MVMQSDVAADFDRLAVYYDLEHHDITDDLPVLTEFARASPGPILELACGTGRVLPALAAAGQPVVGLDYSKAMLQRAQRRSDRRVAHHARCGCCAGTCVPSGYALRFGLIVVAFNSFMHLTTQRAQEQALRVIARHLRPDGRVIVDLFNPASTLDDGSEGALLLHCLHYLPERSAYVLHFHAVRTDPRGAACDGGQLLRRDRQPMVRSSDTWRRTGCATCIARRSNCCGGVPACILRRSTAITTWDRRKTTARASWS